MFASRQSLASSEKHTSFGALEALGSAGSSYASRAAEPNHIDDWYTIDASHVCQTHAEHHALTIGVADLHVVEPKRFNAIPDHDKIAVEAAFVAITRRDSSARTKGKVIAGGPDDRSASKSKGDDLVGAWIHIIELLEQGLGCRWCCERDQG